MADELDRIMMLGAEMSELELQLRRVEQGGGRPQCACTPIEPHTRTESQRLDCCHDFLIFGGRGSRI
jgi:hypothetical protein